MSLLRKPVLITGLACVHPLGHGLHSCNDRLHQIPSDDPSVSWYDNCFGAPPIGRLASGHFGLELTPIEIRSFDRITMAVCATIQQCLEDAGISSLPNLLSETGVISGSAFGCLESQDRLRKVLTEKGPAYFDPLQFPLTSHNFPISAASIKFGLKGPITAMISSMSSGLNALIYCAYQIMKGRAQRMIAIAFDEITDLQYTFLKEKKRLKGTAHNHSAYSSKPVYSSECCVAWMLESAESVKQRNGKVYAFLEDWYIHAGRFEYIDEDALYTVIRRGLDSKKDNEVYRDISYVANGSGLQHEDDVENRVLVNLSNEGIQFRECIRLKPDIGHCLGSSGLIEGALLLKQYYVNQLKKRMCINGSAPLFLLNSFGMGSNLISVLVRCMLPVRKSV